MSILLSFYFGSLSTEGRENGLSRSNQSLAKSKDIPMKMSKKFLMFSNFLCIVSLVEKVFVI